MRRVAKRISRVQESKGAVAKAAFIVIMVCALASAQAVVLPKTAKLVPPETVLLIDIDNFGQLKGQFEKTDFYKLYKDPVMAAFISDVKAKWNKKIQQLDKNDLFGTIFNADVLPHGRVAVALVLNEQTKDANEPPLIFISQWGENIGKIKEAVNKMVEENTALGGYKKRSEDYRGVNIEMMLDEKSSAFSYCFIDDCYIGAANTELLKFLIAQLKGASSPTLADDADYTAAAGAVGPYHDIDLYVNIKQLIKVLASEDTTGQAQAAIANLGVDNAAAFGCSFGFAREAGCSSEGKAFLKVNGSKKGIFKMLEAESGVIKAPRFIPSSAYSVSFLNLDIKRAYGELYNILYSFSPMHASLMLTPILPPGPEGEPGVQLKSDIIDHIGSQIVISQSIDKPFSADSAPTESLFAVAASNSKALEKSLSLVHSKTIALNNPDAKRELLGHTIYLISLPGLPFFSPGMVPMEGPEAPIRPQVPKMAFTVTNTHLIFGTESTVEKAIRTLSSTTASSVDSAKWFSATKSAIPSVVGLANLEDNSSSGELFWWLMKEGSKSRAANMPMGPNVGLGFLGIDFDLFDFGLLPEFEAVRKYFGLSASYGVSRLDGFFFEFKYLNPAGTE